MEDRIIRLEETLALQDRTIEQLSEALGEQQIEISALTRQLQVLAARFNDFGATQDSGSTPPADDAPPHYL